MVHILTTTPLKIHVEPKNHQIKTFKTQKHLPPPSSLGCFFTPNKLKSWSSTQKKIQYPDLWHWNGGFSPLVVFSVSGHLKTSSSEVKLPVASMICEASPSQQLFVPCIILWSFLITHLSLKQKSTHYNINNNNQQGKQTTRISWYTSPRASTHQLISRHSNHVFL